MKKNKYSSLFSFILYSFCIFSLLSTGGCGRKGELKAPEGSIYSYPGQYPPEE